MIERTKSLRRRGIRPRIGDADGGRHRRNHTKRQDAHGQDLHLLGHLEMTEQKDGH